MAEIRVLDSSGWIEWLLAGSGAGSFAPLVALVDQLIVPAISIFEVVRWALLNGSATQAEAAAELMRRGKVEDLDADLAIAAALLCRTHKLSVADSIILATAQRHGAILWTQDKDFQDIDGVRYIPKPLN